MLREQKAQLVGSYEFRGKNNKITSLAISPNGRIIVLLNHDKLWNLSNFKNDEFFKGTINQLPFDHDSQKEVSGLKLKMKSSLRMNVRDQLVALFIVLS